MRRHVHAGRIGKGRLSRHRAGREVDGRDVQPRRTRRRVDAPEACALGLCRRLGNGGCSVGGEWRQPGGQVGCADGLGILLDLAIEVGIPLPVAQ
jgi:hypothetical protein